MDIGIDEALDGIPGVFEARQSRSVKSRDSFVHAGIEALNTMRFDDLKIADLAAASGNSVGSFYTRFQDKAAFFTALRAQTVEAIERDLTADFTVQKLRSGSAGQGLDALVDMVGAVFASRYRGVLRESFARIADPDDPWAPIRRSARQTLTILHQGLSDAFPGANAETTKTRLSFCFQMIVGVMQNELVNNNHVFNLQDGSVLVGLKEAVRAYMGVTLDGAA